MAAVMATQHPNVVRMLGVSEREGNLLLVMERCDGRCVVRPPSCSCCCSCWLGLCHRCLRPPASRHLPSPCRAASR